MAEKQFEPMGIPLHEALGKVNNNQLLQVPLVEDSPTEEQDVQEALKALAPKTTFTKLNSELQPLASSIFKYMEMQNFIVDVLNTGISDGVIFSLENNFNNAGIKFPVPFRELPDTHKQEILGLLLDHSRNMITSLWSDIYRLSGAAVNLINTYRDYDAEAEPNDPTTDKEER